MGFISRECTSQFVNPYLVMIGGLTLFFNDSKSTTTYVYVSTIIKFVASMKFNSKPQVFEVFIVFLKTQ